MATTSYEPQGQSFSTEFRGKSAYHAEDYLGGVANRTVPVVPIFAVGGWADPLFPAVETLQMYRRLKQADSRYPIWMVLDDTGHTRPDDEPHQQEVKSANDQRTAFFDRYLKGEAVDVGPKVVSRAVSCGDASAVTAALFAPSWDHARGSAVTLRGGSIPQTTTHAGRSSDRRRCRAARPGVHRVERAHAGCRALDMGAPPSGVTVLGLPTMSVDYRLTGTDSTVVAKLWDIAPGGGVDRVRTLLTHGVYRLTASTPTSSGRLFFQLFGSHWQIAAGHQIELELMQSDAPMFQADKLASSLVLSSPAVILPTARRS